MVVELRAWHSLTHVVVLFQTEPKWKKKSLFDSGKYKCEAKLDLHLNVSIYLISPGFSLAEARRGENDLSQFRAPQSCVDADLTPARWTSMH